MAVLREPPAAGSQTDSLLQHNKSHVLNLEKRGGFFFAFILFFIALLIFLPRGSQHTRLKPLTQSLGDASKYSYHIYLHLLLWH